MYSGRGKFMPLPPKSKAFEMNIHIFGHRHHLKASLPILDMSYAGLSLGALSAV